MKQQNCISKQYAIVAICGLGSLSAMAHSPLFDCFAEENNTIVCEAGFSDGASATGANVRVLNVQGRVVEQGQIADNGTVTFSRPDEEFSVVFSAGEGHTITVFGDDIY